MIFIAQGERCFKEEINRLSESDPFGCRVVSLYRTYDYSLPFVDFWVQTVDGEDVSLIARLEDVCILRLTEKSDIEEISAFIRMMSFVTVLCDGRYRLDCNMTRFEGPLFSCTKTQPLNGNYIVFEPTVKEFYSVISRCSSDNFQVPPYESFILDVNNKLKKGTVRMYALGDSEPAACIMTLAESGDSAVLGGLAVLPEYRRAGLGAFLISYINNELLAEGKRVYLHRAADENIEFYEKSGFEKYGVWAEYRQKGNV